MEHACGKVCPSSAEAVETIVEIVACRERLLVASLKLDVEAYGEGQRIA